MAVPRRRHGADVSAAVRRAGSLSRGGNLHAGSGPLFPPPPPSLSVCLCFAVAFYFSLSFALGSWFCQKFRNLQNKNLAKTNKTRKTNIICLRIYFPFSSCLGPSVSPEFFSINDTSFCNINFRLSRRHSARSRPGSSLCPRALA